jgi:uncharacterized delta-60 repeat protein
MVPMKSSWFARLFQRSPRTASTRTARSGSFRPALEALEERTLLSAGALDLTFGGTGIVITHAGIGGPSFEGARAMAIDHQGNIVVAGTAKIGNDYDFAVLRYHPDGTLDNSFGNGGKRTIDVDASGHDDGAYGVAIDSQGRIVLAGYANNGTEDDFAVVRLNANGSLDTSFNGTGIETTAVATPSPGYSAAYAVAVDGQDRIVAAGYAKVGNDDDFAVVRYNTDGSLDSKFGGGGKRTVDMDGAGFNDLAYGVAIDSQGRIVLAGQVYNGTDSDFGVARLTPTGALDGTFNNSGKVIYHAGTVTPSFDAAHGVAIDSQGRIVVAGTSKIGPDYDFTVLRFTVDGNPDSNFANNGKRTIDVDGSGHDDGAYGVAIDGNGRIVLAGYASNGSVNNLAFARLLSNGSTDFTFGTGGKFVTNASSTGGNNQAYGMAVDAVGRVVAAGYAANATDSDFATVRLTPDLPAETYVASAYTLLLNRGPDPGAQVWVNMLTSGIAPSTVVADIEQSLEYRTDEVKSLYQHYLNRGLDQGAQGWIDLLAGGATIEAVTAGILNSPEYFAKHGGSNSGFIQGLYQDVLGRAGSADEVQGWINALSSGLTRAQVAMGFLTSTEYRTDLVDADYTKFLLRSAEPAAQAAWVQALASGMSDQAVLAGIFGSAEGYAKWS